MDPTAFVIPCLLAGVALYALTRRVDVYAALTQGAGEGLAWWRKFSRRWWGC